MNRTRSLAAAAFAVLLTATSASAATVTFTFFNGTGFSPDLPTNISQDGASDLCGGGNTDVCASMLEFQKNGITLQVRAFRPGFPNSTQPIYVNEDLAPSWGGLGVDGGTTDNTGGDNIGVGEMLKLSFSQNVKLKSFVAFRDHQNFYNGTGDPTTITVVSDSPATKFFDVPVGPGAPLPNLGNALFAFSPTFAGSIFDFSINAETFYISQLTVETVPEPSTLLVFGLALLGGARAYRRRMAA